MSDKNKKTISNMPLRGTVDWLPEEFLIRKYIFDTWRKVCLSFGYEEYLCPIVENADVYRAKSGEDVGGSELMIIKKEDQEIAIRPEMTPSVTRMVTRIYNGVSKPIRLFSIANFMRYQKPQRGRNREFWQLNFDIFGADSINADIEILQLALEIMLSFNPPKNSFTLFINNRKLIDTILDKIVGIDSARKIETVRILDKWEKLTREEIIERLSDLNLNNNQIDKVIKFLISDSSESLITNLPELEQTEGYQEIIKVSKTLTELGYKDWINFQPNIIRGFDYYDGMIFEVFDKNPKNNRALFGGGRYNGLASIFGSQSFPAVGCAPGDETTKLFLEGWGLLDQIKENLKQTKIYIPLLEESFLDEINAIAKKIRKMDLSIISGLEVQSLGKSIQFADKNNFDYVVILGSEEKNANEITLKNMKSGEQKSMKIDEIEEWFSNLK